VFYGTTLRLPRTCPYQVKEFHVFFRRWSISAIPIGKRNQKLDVSRVIVCIFEIRKKNGTHLWKRRFKDKKNEKVLISVIRNKLVRKVFETISKIHLSSKLNTSKESMF
jgi:hypothetical protein